MFANPGNLTVSWEIFYMEFLGSKVEKFLLGNSRYGFAIKVKLKKKKKKECLFVVYFVALTVPVEFSQTYWFFAIVYLWSGQ